MTSKREYAERLREAMLCDADEVRGKLRIMVKGFKQLGVSQNGVARRMGITNGHLSRVLRGEKEPGEKVLSWLGMESVTFYRNAK